MNMSPASSDADSSTFGLPGGVVDTDSGIVLCENDESVALVEKMVSVVVDTTEDKGTRSRPLLRLAIGILLLVIGLLLDARRFVDAAALMLL